MGTPGGPFQVGARGKCPSCTPQWGALRSLPLYNMYAADVEDLRRTIIQELILH